jgi:PAS domain S-box-containing protein
MSEVIQLQQPTARPTGREDQLRNALRHSVDAIVVIDPAHERIVEANKRACRLLGYRRREIINCEIAKIHPLDLPLLREFMASVIEQGCGWTDELSCTGRHGDIIPAEMAASSMSLRGRTHVVAVVHSVSERKTREAELIRSAKELEREVDRRTSELRSSNARLNHEVRQRRAAEQKLRALVGRHQLILESVGEGILETDIEGKVSFINSDGLALLGCSPRQVGQLDVIGMFKNVQTGHSLEQRSSSLIEEVVRKGAPHYLEEAVVLQRGGCALPVELTCKPIRETSKLTSVVIVFRDISRRKQREQRLRDALSEIERLKQRVEAENIYLLEELHSNHDFREIVGRGAAISKVLRQVKMVAPTDASVLITGESGTGKELIARAIHDLSPRKARPLIKVNCAAIPRELFESEFFGHVRGAFTGANTNRIGRFELANGGTLFLDEIGELPIDLQSKLLGVLQEGRFERVGDGKSLTVNTRIISATNRDLETEVAARRFSLDLYYRLNKFPIALPPLRQRPDDIVPLAEYLMGVASERLRCPNFQLSEEHHEQLLAYDWPGNVREMQNAVERALILSRGHRPPRFDLPAVESVSMTEAPSPVAVPVMHERQRIERDKQNIENALRCTRGRIAGPDGAALLLGINPSTLRSRIKAYGVSLAPALIENSVANS